MPFYTHRFAREACPHKPFSGSDLQRHPQFRPVLARPLNHSVAMKVAIPHWQGRVSPVFDAASRLLLVEAMEGGESGRAEWVLSATDPAMRAGELQRSGADVLICGAISRPLEVAVTAAGIRVIAQICGQVEEVISAFLGGRLSDPVYLMPGCCGRRRRFRGGAGSGGSQAEGPCVCPACGYEVVHVRGQPCGQKACPVCGTKLSRRRS
jgi:predicted Fe-Mo cluster-binding NifX family protein